MNYYFILIKFIYSSIYITTFPDEILSVYFSSAFSFLITFEFTSFELPTLA